MFDPGSLSLPDSAEPHRASGRGAREGRWETAISCDLRRSFGIDSETVDGEGPNIDGVEMRPIVREVSVASTKAARSAGYAGDGLEQRQPRSCSSRSCRFRYS